MSLSKHVLGHDESFEARISFSSKILLFKIKYTLNALEERRELGEHIERFLSKVSVNPFSWNKVDSD